MIVRTLTLALLVTLSGGAAPRGPCQVPNGDARATPSTLVAARVGEPPLALCGNGIIDPGEECDGADLANASCQTLGFSSGVLACSSTCSFDTSGCVHVGPPVEDTTRD